MAAHFSPFVFRANKHKLTEESRWVLVNSSEKRPFSPSFGPNKHAVTQKEHVEACEKTICFI